MGKKIKLYFKRLNEMYSLKKVIINSLIMFLIYIIIDGMDIALKTIKMNISIAILILVNFGLIILIKISDLIKNGICQKGINNFDYFLMNCVVVNIMWLILCCPFLEIKEYLIIVRTKY